MTLENSLLGHISQTIVSLYQVEVADAQIQFQKTKKEFEGNITLVTFPFVKPARKAPEAVGAEIGEYLKANAEEVARQDTTITMYVPNLVTITSPKIETEEELFPYCYYKGLELRWNADADNENGLVVMVEWFGSNLNQDKKDQYVRNLDILQEDNGVAILNDKLFDNIPEFGIAYITLLRGNITLLEDYGNDPYRLVAASQAMLPFILIRNI